jgi:hypothetical protein
MADRILFIISVVVIVVALASTGWLVASGQAFTVDGLFLLLTCGLVALAFALYLWFLIGRALKALQPPPAKAAPSATAAAAKKAAPAPVEAE